MAKKYGSGNLLCKILFHKYNINSKFKLCQLLHKY